VLGVERGIESENIPDRTEIFLFTDNFVMERAFLCGTSKSKMLFDLVTQVGNEGETIHPFNLGG
jgi:hypothetical protein